jgi:protoporphyrinogen oxidase
VIEECYLGLWEAHRRYGPDPLKSAENPSFREWCERLFGKGISRHFMIPYNQKLWRTSVNDMTPDWCGQFVPQPKLDEVLAGALSDQTKAYGYNATFLYPKRGGIQALAQSFAKGLPGIRTGVSVASVLWREKKIRLDTGEEVPYARLVSTMPLAELLKRLEPFPEELRKPSERLRWTSILDINVGVRRPKISDKSWIYFPENKFVFYRVGFPMNFTPHAVPRGCSSMYVEVSYRPGTLPATPAERASLFRRVREGLIAARVLKRSDTFPVVSFLPIKYAYVVYDFHRSAALARIFSWLDKKASASSIGRYGAWKYSFMEEAILDGKRTAEGITERLRGLHR